MQNIYNTVEMLNKIKIVKTNPSFGFVGYSDQDPFFFFFFFFFFFQKIYLDGETWFVSTRD